MLASLHLWKQAIHTELSEEKRTVLVQAAEEVISYSGFHNRCYQDVGKKKKKSCFLLPNRP
jgi:hypothetical protein